MKKKYDSEFAFRYHRKSTRLKDHNYGWSGTYFITICAEQDEPVFEIPELHTILLETWQALPGRFPGLELDEFVIMPDHVHFILRLEGNIEKSTTLARVIGAFKSITTVEWLKHNKNKGLEIPGIIWQRGFHDEIIFDMNELQAIRQYIRDNPIKLQKHQDDRHDHGKNHTNNTQLGGNDPRVLYGRPSRSPWLLATGHCMLATGYWISE